MDEKMNKDEMITKEDMIKAVQKHMKELEILEAIKRLGPFTMVGGDSAQHSNPHARQFVNSNVSWAVSKSDRSARKLREDVELINAFIDGTENV